MFSGSVNALAPVKSMLFLMTYAILNFACYIMTITGAPNWRPTFPFYNWMTALFGALFTLAMMFLVSPLYTSLAFGIFIVLIVIIHLRAPSTAWGDVSQVLYMFTISLFDESHVFLIFYAGADLSPSSQVSFTA